MWHHWHGTTAHGVHDGDGEGSWGDTVEGQPKRGLGANLATRRSRLSRGWRSHGRTDGPRQFQQVFIGLRFLLGFWLHKRREPKTGRLIFRQRAEGRGKLAPLKSWAVSRWQRSKKGGAELREGGR